MSRSWAQQLFEFETYGFTVLPAVLDAATSSDLATRLDLLDEQRGIDYVHDNAFARHISSVYADDDDFMDLIDHPDVLGFIETVLGPQIILGSCNARIVRPGDPFQGFHSDIPSQFRRSGAPVMVNAVWMLDAFTPENGATRFVPGGHLAASAAPPPDVSIPYEVQAVGPVGSVLIFNGQCWHGGGANKSDGGPSRHFRPLPRQPVDALCPGPGPLGLPGAVGPHDDTAAGAAAHARCRRPADRRGLLLNRRG